MNRILFLLSMAIVSYSTAQDIYPRMDQSTELYGYADADDNWIISAQYQYAGVFVDGVAKVQKNDLYGLINRSNALIVPIAYAEMGDASFGLVMAKNAVNGKYGYFDLNGKKVIDFIYEGANYFSSGLAGAKQNGKWGFIDTKGKVVIPFQFDAIVLDADDDWITLWLGVSTDMGYSFYNDYAIVMKDGHYGMINKLGNTLVDFKYESLTPVNGNSLIAKKCDLNNENCTYGVLNNAGAIVIPFAYSYITTTGEYYKLFQGTSYDNLFGEMQGGVMGFADASGKVIAPCIYDNQEGSLYTYLFDGMGDQRFKRSGFYEGMFHAAKNDRWGYLDASGKEVIPFQFESATSFARDSAQVTLNGFSFFIDKLGRCIKDCPSDINMLTSATVGDQTQNMTDVTNTIMKLVIDDANTLAGEAMNLRKLEVYSGVQSKLDLIISYGTDGQKKLAKYFKLLTNNQLGTIKGAKSVRDAIGYLRPIRYIADGFTYSDFPLPFDYKGQERFYSYDHFKDEYLDYYALLSECEYKMKDPMAENDLKKAAELETYDRDKALYTSYLIDFKQHQKGYNAELLDYSNRLLETYVGMDNAERHWLDSLNLWVGNQPAAIEAAYTSNSTEKIPDSFYLKAYPLYRQLGEEGSANYFIEKLYKSGYDDYNFLWEMTAMAKTQNNNQLGNDVAEKLAIKTGVSDCYNLQRLAELYLSLNNASEAKATKQKADDCYKQQQKQTEKTERENKKRDKKYDSSYGVNRGLYIGADIFPMLSTVKGHKDFGFCVDFVGRKRAHEFYYEIINKNRDWMYDLSIKETETDGFDVRWDGYNAHYAFKVFTEDDNTAPYVGLLARYRSKTFEPIVSTVSDVNNILISSEQLYSPTEKQFELFLNYGFMTTKPGFACDMYFGFGPKYSIFSHNIDNYKSDDIYSHPLLENRAEVRWGLGFRVGITVGFKVF